MPTRITPTGTTTSLARNTGSTTHSQRLPFRRDGEAFAPTRITLTGTTTSLARNTSSTTLPLTTSAILTRGGGIRAHQNHTHWHQPHHHFPHSTQLPPPSTHNICHLDVRGRSKTPPLHVSAVSKAAAASVSVPGGWATLLPLIYFRFDARMRLASEFAPLPCCKCE